MQIGYFAHNGSSGISMVKKDKTLWNASYENFLRLISEVESSLLMLYKNKYKRVTLSFYNLYDVVEISK